MGQVELSASLPTRALSGPFVGLPGALALPEYCLTRSAQKICVVVPPPMHCLSVALGCFSTEKTTASVRSRDINRLGTAEGLPWVIQALTRLGRQPKQTQQQQHNTTTKTPTPKVTIRPRLSLKGVGDCTRQVGRGAGEEMGFSATRSRTLPITVTANLDRCDDTVSGNNIFRRQGDVRL